MKKYLILFLAVFIQANTAFACEQSAQKAPIYSGSSEECDNEDSCSQETCEA